MTKKILPSFAAFSLLILSLLVAACDKPTPTQPQNPATTHEGPQTQVNPAGPLFFESRDTKPSYHVALQKGDTAGGLLLTVHPQGAYKINMAYPISLTLDDGSTYESEQFQVSERACKLVVEGKKPETLTGTLKFGVCTAEHCEAKQVQISTAPAETKPPKSTGKTTEVTL